MNINDLVSNPAVWGVLGSLLTGIITYRTAINKDGTELAIQRETYVDKQIQQLIDSYRQELTELKTEIKELTNKNQELVEEVLNLKAKIIELEGLKNDEEIE